MDTVHLSKEERKQLEDRRLTELYNNGIITWHECLFKLTKGGNCDLAYELGKMRGAEEGRKKAEEEKREKEMQAAADLCQPYFDRGYKEGYENTYEEATSANSTDTEVRNQVDRLRRKARRKNLSLKKSRVRNPNSCDYGRYGIFNPETGGLAPGSPFTLDLDEIEEWLSEDEEE